MMTEDIPAGFMEKIYGNNAAGSQKKKARNRKRKTNQGFLPYQTKWKIPVYLQVKKYRPGPPGENTPEKERLAGIS